MTDKEQVEQEEVIPESEPLLWGKRLREVREANDIALRDVAAELHLDLGLLEALENEDIDALPNASFVKGYLRSYARLLDMPADELVDAYECSHGEGAPCLKRIGKVNKQTTSQDKGPRYATWGVIAVLVISMLAWWSSKILTNGVSERESSNGDLALEIAEAPSSEGLQTEVIVEMEPVAVAPIPEPKIEEPVEVATVVAEPEPVQQEVSEPPAVPVVDEADLSKLGLVFSEDSWVEITDVRGKRLYFDLGREGQERELAGVAPFKVLLGNAPGVALTVNGEPYDHVRYQRNGVAKFTLSE